MYDMTWLWARSMVAKNMLRCRPLRRTCSAYPPISYSPAQPVIADDDFFLLVCWGTFLNFFAFFVCTFCTRYMHAGTWCGVRVGMLEHVALEICMSSVCTSIRGPLCPLYSHFVVLLVSERSGRRKPPAERSALYHNAINQQLRISVPLIAHLPVNHFYCSPGAHQLPMQRLSWANTAAVSRRSPS